MKIFLLVPYRIKSASLQWKLLIPFLFFALARTFFLAYVGLRSQQKSIRDEEEKGLMQSYHRLLEEDREAALLDLPFARIIIHRHGGKVDLRREAENELVMTIELPTRPLAEKEP